MAGGNEKLLGWLALAFLGYLTYKAIDKKPSQAELIKKAVLSQATLPEIRRKAAQLTRGCQNNEICRIEKIYRFVADQIDYMPDPWNEEYFANALETLYVGAGDCDCKSILLATLLRANGFIAALNFVPGHVLVEALVTPLYVSQIPRAAYARMDEETGGRWILLESTAQGAQIGWVDSDLFQTYLSSSQERRIEI